MKTAVVNIRNGLPYFVPRVGGSTRFSVTVSSPFDNDGEEVEVVVDTITAATGLVSANVAACRRAVMCRTLSATTHKNSNDAQRTIDSFFED